MRYFCTPNPHLLIHLTTMKKNLLFMLLALTCATWTSAQPTVGSQRTTLAPAKKTIIPTQRSESAGQPNATRGTKPAATARTNQSPRTNVAPVTPKGGTATKQAEVKINWMTYEEAVEKCKTEKRKIFVDVYTDWCGWCKKMDSSTFVDPAVAKYMNEKYYAVKFDAEQTKDIAYKGKTYKFVNSGGRGYHELAALWLNNRMSYPSFVFLDEDHNIIQSLAGYQEAAKLDVILHYFGTDNHKKTPWEKYERNYVRER
jgi:thioredoxin-related protein